MEKVATVEGGLIWLLHRDVVSRQVDLYITIRDFGNKFFFLQQICILNKPLIYQLCPLQQTPGWTFCQGIFLTTMMRWGIEPLYLNHNSLGHLLCPQPNLQLHTMKEWNTTMVWTKTSIWTMTALSCPIRHLKSRQFMVVWWLALTTTWGKNMLRLSTLPQSLLMFWLSTLPCVLLMLITWLLISNCYMTQTFLWNLNFGMETSTQYYFTNLLNAWHQIPRTSRTS